MSAIEPLSTTTFDVRQLIRDAIDETGEPNPHVIAARVLPKIPRQHLAEVLAMTLPDFVRTMNYRPREEEKSLRSVGTAAAPARKRAAGRRFRAFLDESVCLDETKSLWKRLGQCSREEVIELARLRRVKADQNLAKAGTFDRLAEKMRVHRVSTVADLDDQLISEVLT